MNFWDLKAQCTMVRWAFFVFLHRDFLIGAVGGPLRDAFAAGLIGSETSQRDG